MNLDVSGMRQTVLKLAWPIIVQQLLVNGMLLVDTLMLGFYSTTSLAASGVADPLLFSARMVLMAIPIATTAMVARAIGENNLAKARHNAAVSLSAGLLIGIIVSLIGYQLAGPIIKLYLKTPEIIYEATLYFKLVISVFVFNYLYLIATSICRGAGDTRTPMLISIGANILNVIGDYLLIYGKFGCPELGIKGAAISTMVSSVIECTALIIFIFTRHSKVPMNLTSFVTIKIEQFKTLLRVSIPAAIEPFIIQMGMLLFLKMVTQLGEASIAAHRILLRIEGISFMPGIALSIACAAIVGQSLGAQKIDSAKAGCRESNKLALFIMCTCGIIFVAIPSFLLGLFTPDKAVIAIGTGCLMIAALEQPFIGYTMVHRGALQGAGDTRSPIWVAIIGVWLVRLPLIYWLTLVKGYGLFSIWATTPIDWAVRALVFRILYRRGRWKEIKI